ncbi:MAG: class I SAM-dependent methyltransferase [Mycobacteriales bacterium]
MTPGPGETGSGSPNARTLAAYERAAAQWRDATSAVLTPAKEAFLTELVARVPAGGSVLEIGSGTGRDAAWLEGCGLRVRRTDGCASFVELMRADGLAAEVLDVLVDDLGGPYDLVYASAVLLHLDEADLRRALHRMAAAAGLLAFTLKEGEGEEWSEAKIGLPRYFRYWTADALSAVLAEVGLTPLVLRSVEGLRDRWVLAICAT